MLEQGAKQIDLTTMTDFEWNAVEGIWSLYNK